MALREKGRLARLSDQPIEPRDLREYLEGQDDFDLELFAYRTAKECGLRVSYGGSYEDPVTRKPRQYDVRATIDRRDQRVELAVECKGLRDSYPLLVSRVPRSNEDSFHEVIYAHVPDPGAPFVMPGIDTVDVLRSRDNHCAYPPGEHVGKSTAQVGRNEKGDLKSGDRDVYDKWAQALASASDPISSAAWAHEKRGLPSFSTAVLPVLVVSDATLWVADYSSEGQLMGDPYQTDDTTLFVGHTDQVAAGPSYTMSHLHIVTRRQLKPFLTDLLNGQGRWSRLFPNVM